MYCIYIYSTCTVYIYTVHVHILYCNCYQNCQYRPPMILLISASLPASTYTNVHAGSDALILVMHVHVLLRLHT